MLSLPGAKRREALHPKGPYGRRLDSIWRAICSFLARVPDPKTYRRATAVLPQIIPPMPDDAEAAIGTPYVTYAPEATSARCSDTQMCPVCISCGRCPATWMETLPAVGTGLHMPEPKQAIDRPRALPLLRPPSIFPLPAAAEAVHLGMHLL